MALAACQTTAPAPETTKPPVAVARPVADMPAAASDVVPAAAKTATIALGPVPAFAFASEQLLAEPVTAALAQTYPHLKAHPGSLVLGSENVQLVLSGVSAEVSPASWVSALEAAYGRTAQGWRRLASAGSWDMRISAPQGQAIYPVGLDTEKGGDHASIVYFLGSRDGRGAATEMRWTFNRLTHVATVSVTGAPDAGDAGFAWKLRWRDRWGASAAEADAPAPGPRVHTQYLNEDVSSLVVAGTAAPDAGPDAVAWTVSRGRDVPARVFLLLGAKAQESLPRLTADARRCLMGEAPRQPVVAEAADDWQACVGTVPAHAVTFRAPDAPNDLPAMGWLVDLTEKTRSWQAFAPGESRAIPLPKDHAFTVVPALGGTEVPVKDASFPWPGRARGTLVLGAAPLPAAAPSLVTVRAKADADGVGVLAFASGKDPNAWRGPYQALAPSWPASVSLPEGDYAVTVYNGREQRACHRDVRVSAGAAAQVACDDPAGGDGTRPFLKVDLSSADASRDAASFAASLGVDLTAAALAESHAGPYRAITAEDPDEGLSLRLFPVTERQAQYWRKSLASGPGSPLQKLADFRRTRAEKATLEMACPLAPLDAAAIERALGRFTPDALQVYGCGGPARQEALKEAVAAHMRHGEKPILFTAVSGIGTRALRSPYVPTLAVFPGEAPARGNAEAMLAAVLPSLGSGAFSLSAGAVLAPRVVQKVLPPKKGAKGPQTELELKLSLDEGASARAVRVYSEDGLVGEQAVTSPPERNVRIPLRVILAKPVRWLRVEVLGTTVGDDGSAPAPRVIAASNFEELGAVTKP